MAVRMPAPFRRARSAGTASRSSSPRKPARCGTSALAYGGPGTAPGDINFALRLQNGVAEVRESNAYRTEIGFAAGDTLAIVVENNVDQILEERSRLLHERDAGDVCAPVARGAVQCERSR